ncbi:MAG: SdrD B-like domain-containing protein, partial [Actinomycetota bacterium]
TAAAVGEIRGTAFFDENSDGQWDTSFEFAGVQGVEVVAYDDNGNQVSTATTDSTGAYSLAVASGQRVRVEVLSWPDGYEPGPEGDDGGPGVWGSETTVTFATENDEHVDVGFVQPDLFCDTNPDLLTPCYAFGHLDDVPAGEPGTVAVPFDATGQTPPKSWMTPVNQIGAVYGAAWRRDNADPNGGTLLTTSFLKRHADLGPGRGGSDTRTTGGIYEIEQAAGTSATGTLWLDLDADTPIDTGGDPRAFMADPASPGSCTSGPLGDAELNCWLTDPDTFDQIGRRGLGDTDFSPNEDYLFTVNLFNRSLVRIPVAGVPLVADVPNITEYQYTARHNDCPNGDWRPFALGRDTATGAMYLGATCTGQTTFESQAPGDGLARANSPTADAARQELAAIVYRFDPASPGTLTEVLDADLSYDRRDRCNASETTANPASCEGYWNAWSDVPTDFIVRAPDALGQRVRPIPLLADIQVDRDALVLGVRDMSGDVGGHFAFLPGDGPGSTPFQVITYGDILKACGSATGSFQLEDNSTCGGVTGSGSIGDGPGGDEFFDDSWFLDENVTGSIALIQTREDGLIATANHAAAADPSELTERNTAGLRRFNPDDGTNRSPGARIFQSASNPLPIGSTFGKANGLGALVPLCNAAPLEIGNYVWYDLDRDGVQDPDESPVVGATVNLYEVDSGGSRTLVASDVTDAEGEYYFSSEDASYQLLPDQDYVLAVDNADDYDDPAAPLYNWLPTLANAGNGAIPDQNDSDGVVPSGGQFPEISLTTGGPGFNDHSFDFGFAQAGEITVVKDLQGDPAGLNDPTPTFSVVVACTRNGSSIDDQVFITVDGVPTASPVAVSDGQTLAIGGVPIGSSCQLTENTPDPGLLNAGYAWSPPVFSGDGIVTPGYPVTITIPDTLPVDGRLEVGLANAVPADGGFFVQKVVEGPSGGVVADARFEVSVVCVDAGDNPVVPSLMYDGGAVVSPVLMEEGFALEVSGVPLDGECTLTESALDPSDLNPSFVWVSQQFDGTGVPTGNPATVTVGDVEGVTVNMRNTFRQQLGS